MTGTQYKNIIDNTLLDESLEGVTDSVAIARAVFDNCGVPLPQGNCSEIMSTLASDDFVGWRKCTLEEAQEHANNGIAAIGISDDRILIIEPQEEGVISSNLPETAAYSSTMVTANSFSQVDEGGMVFYADTMATTTVEELYFRITDKPTNNTIAAGEEKILRVDSNIPGIDADIYWGSSSQSVAWVSPDYATRTTNIITELYPGKLSYGGSTTISATSMRHARTDSFTLNVERAFLKIVGKPTNNTMIAGDTKTISIETNSPILTNYISWHSSNPSVATFENPFGPTTNINVLSPGSTIIGAYNTAYKIKDEFILTVNSMQIYISPANHYKRYTNPNGGLYDINVWNEKKNLEIVGDYLKVFLDRYYVDVYLDKTDRSGGQQNYKGRPLEANNWITNKNKALYLALHSNSGANGGTTARGSVGYYNHRGNVGPLALAFVDAIDPILPTGSDRSQHTIAGDYRDWVESWEGNLGELSEPEYLNIPSVLIETAFHDNLNEVVFLTSNQQLLAETIGSVLVDFYGLILK